MSQWLSKAHNYFKTRDAFDASAKSESKGGFMQWYQADICQDYNKKLWLCKLAGSEKMVLIPRIKLVPTPGTYPFDWSRLQFPVRVAFSTTINKSQGQTLKHVGIWLRSPVFSHGQFYVACSRVGNPLSLKIAIKKQSEQQYLQTDNVVFKEVLLQSSTP